MKSQEVENKGTCILINHLIAEPDWKAALSAVRDLEMMAGYVKLPYGVTITEEFSTPLSHNIFTLF